MRVVLSFGLVALLAGCARAPAPADVAPDGGAGLEVVRSPEGPFTVGWDPDTGRGMVSQVLPDGDRFELCLQCRYPGYAGGLWAGSMNGSGFLWIPSTPRRGFSSLNLFCAQDESLWDHEEGLEYDCGWSQNFGRGDDGVRLEYLQGEVLGDGRAGDLVLRSVNRGGCWELIRYLFWPRAAAWWLVATHVRNACDTPRRLSFWSGEDPWIGTYRTSEGDVGWTDAGLVRTETAIDGAGFRYGGLYDLGNALTGEAPGSFSGAANFLMPDPATPPDLVLFANRFAHGPEEIQPGRALDNGTLTAINLGWTGRTLGPGETLRIALALGRADADGKEEALPRVPRIPPEAWTFDAVFHEAGRGPFAPGTETATSRDALPIRFREETITLTLDPPWLHVDGLYVFENRTGGAHQTSMYYPVPADAGHPPAEGWEVRGAKWRPAPRGIVWRLALGPRQVASVEVSYRQRCDVPEARYILTSTARWGASLDRGVYEVRWPAGLPGVQVSYDGERTREGDREVLRFRREDFLPGRDLLIRWTAPPP